MKIALWGKSHFRNLIANNHKYKYFMIIIK